MLMVEAHGIAFCMYTGWACADVQVGSSVLLLLDGAHNVDGATVLRYFVCDVLSAWDWASLPTVRVYLWYLTLFMTFLYVTPPY